LIFLQHFNKKISKWCIIILEIALFYLYERDSFAKVSKILARYRFENNFIWTIKIMRDVQTVVPRILQIFTIFALINA